jgi:protein-disulfide isomerase
VIVEFSDYQCPFCRRAEPTLNELLERYPTEVRWEYRHYPLPNHPLAKPAAEAAVCAEAQGQFWEFHEKLFSQERSLDASGLRAYAEDIGLDMARFETCQDAPDTRERVAADQRAGKRAGAAGTPAFFVNGVFLTGARPLEDFEKLIRAELARASQTAKYPTD